MTFAHDLKRSEGPNHVASWGKCGPQKEAVGHVRGTARQQVLLGPGVVGQIVGGGDGG